MEINTFTNCTINEIQNFKDKELRIAGIISATATKTSKNGNQYVSFTLEDFDGAHQFALFGKDYIKYKNFAETFKLFLWKANTKPQYGQENNFEFKISEIELLSEIRDKIDEKNSVHYSTNGSLAGKYDSTNKNSSTKQQRQNSFVGEIERWTKSISFGFIF